MSRSARQACTAVLALAMAAGLAGCASAEPVATTDPATTEPVQPPGVACVDWVHFETPRDAAADAGAVLRGTVVERDGTAQLYGVEANRWLVDVEEVLERPDPARSDVEPQPELMVSPGERIAVVSTPETCSGSLYPEGDPLDPATGLGDADGTVIFLLSAAGGTGEGGEGFHLITPFQGVVTPASGGTLPPEWPAP